MPLAPGAKLGPYEILAPIGEGGMGEVYKARDTRLNRHVAIKLSAAAFSDRFTREAALVASLNHPNICTLFDVGPNYLVMELIEGPTLFDRFAQGALPLEEAIPIAIQIADALEAAHDKGIIHRDLKPANIKLTADGKVKVLDFGLAKALDDDQSSPSSIQANSPTLAPTRVAATQAGFILGTAAYMAPEQARGHAADRRSDIWSFGVVLYEMTTARRLFDGETVSDTLAEVLKHPIDFTPVPPQIQPLLSRCLTRDRKQRLQAIGEARIALETPPAPLPKATPAPTQPRKLQWLPWALASILAIAIAILYFATRPAPAPLTALDVDLGIEQPTVGMAGPTTILSPDGRRIAYLDAERQLWTRTLDQVKPRLLATGNLLQGIHFSPDGRWIAFAADGKLAKVLVEGGAPIPLAAVRIGSLRGLAWSPDGSIYFGDGNRSGIQRISAEGGAVTAVTTLDASRYERAHRWPSILPNGKALLFAASTSNRFDDARIELLRLDTGARQTLIQGGTFPHYAPSGHIFYARGDTFFAVPFNARSLQLTGTPLPILEGILHISAMGYYAYHFSQTGTFAYRRGRTLNSPIQRMDASGAFLPFGSNAVADNGGYAIALAPGGKHFAISSGGTISAYDPATDRRIRLAEGGTTTALVWSPDGAYLLLSSPNDALWWVSTTGGAQAAQLRPAATPIAFTPDGRFLLVNSEKQTRRLTLDASSGTPRVTADEPLSEFIPPTARFSPDGRWISYTQDRTVFVAPWPALTPRWPVMETCTNARWMPRSNEILCRSDDSQIMAIPYAIHGNVFSPAKPRVWAPLRVSALFAFEIDPGGNHIIGAFDTTGDSSNRRTTFLFNFFDELKRKFATTTP